MTTLRGHGPKIRKAVEALEAHGEQLRYLRPVRRNKLILDWLGGNGYGADLPSRTSLSRYFSVGRCKADKSVRSVSAEMPV
jgi:hypothetical protein